MDHFICTNEVKVGLRMYDTDREPRVMSRIASKTIRLHIKCPIASCKEPWMEAEEGELEGLPVCSSCRKVYCYECAFKHLLSAQDKRCPTCRMDWSAVREREIPTGTRIPSLRQQVRMDRRQELLNAVPGRVEFQLANPEAAVVMDGVWVPARREEQIAPDSPATPTPD